MSINIEQQHSKRDLALDITRGLMIICIVWVHALERHIFRETVISGEFYNILYMYNVAVIFFINGYLVYKKTSVKWTGKYVIKLFVPLVSGVITVWIVGYFFGLHNIFATDGQTIASNFWSYINKEFWNGVGNLILWYIWTLIMLHCVTTLFEWIIKNKEISKIPLGYLIIAFLVILNVLPYNKFNFDTVKWYGIMYFSGYYFKHLIVNYKFNREKLFKWLRWLLYIGSPIGIIVLGLLTNWMRGFGHPQAFAGYTNALYTISTRSDGIWIVIVLYIAFVLKVASSYTVAKGIEWLLNWKWSRWFAKAILYCGVNSIGLYLLHTHFIKLTNNVWFAFAVSMIASIVIYEVSRRWKWSNFVLFGGSDISDKIIKKLVK